MKRILPTFGVVLVAGLTVVTGIIYGRMSNRWGPSPDMVAAAKRLEAFPEQFGNWRLRSSETMEDFAINMLECAGHISRTYENQASGERVSLMVLLGPSGPISVHTPEVCLVHKDKDERQRVTIQDLDGCDHEFWARTFQLHGPSADMLRVYYAWSTGGRWLAPADPRFSLAAHPYIYKMQLSCNLLPGVHSEANDPCRKLLQDFVPAVKRYLVAPADN